ncbi:four helix bundle protein [Candidatus Daviesbacteria bacterium]|nr:four helix bundle protein [Candidatus Daviesbacteria bacterium]
MGKITKFSDLDAWQEAHMLVDLVYKLTNRFPKSEVYGLTSQLRRAVVSITANIAEGFSRFHYKDRLRFYYDARGSLSEVQSELLDALKVGLINQSVLDKVWPQTERVHLLLGGLIRKTSELSKNS